MGVVDAIAEGCLATVRRPILLAPTVALDLLFWFGDRLTAAPLFEALIRGAQLGGGAGIDADSVRELRDYAGQTNLFTLLAVGQQPLLPMLKAGQVARPWGQGTIDPGAWWAVILGALGLAALGLLALSLTLAALAQAIREEPFAPRAILRRTPAIWLRLLAVVGLVLAGLLIVGMPLLILAVFLAALGIDAAALLVLALLPLCAIAYVYLALAPEAIAVSDAGPLRAIKLSVGIVRRNFWATVGLLAAIFLIGQGLPIGWALLTKYPAGVPLAIVGNAALGTGLTAAGLAFYRERLAALENPQPSQPSAGTRDRQRDPRRGGRR